AARRCRGDAVLLLHVRHDPVQRALAGLGGPGPGAPARPQGLPAWVRDPPYRLRRAGRRPAPGTPPGGPRPPPPPPPLDEELPHLHRGDRSRGADPHLRVLRPDPHAARVGPAVVGPARR